MADPLRQTYGEVFFLTNGLQRDPYGLANFHPASNVNRLDVYLEDGVSTNVVMVNFRADGKNFPTSVFFPTLYGGTVQKVITGEATARTFAKYSLLVPPQVLQWNANGSAPLGLTATVVQTAGDGLLGAFATYTELTTTHTATQILYDDGAIAYVYSTEGVNEYGFYMVSYDSGTDTYSWVEVDNPVTQINMVDTKQYNIVGMQIQKGNLPSPTHGVTISDAYIRYILAYLAQINDIALANQTAIGDSSTSGSIIFRLDVIEADIDAIIAGTQDITYDPTISGLVSTTIKGAIDEIVGRLDTAEEDIVALEGRMDTAEEDIDNLETFQNVTVPATYETIANADTHRGRTTALENANMVKSIAVVGTNLFTITFYDDTTSNVLTLAQLKTFIGEATNALSGLMTAQHVTDLEMLMALFDGDGDAVVNTIAEVLAIFENYPEGVDLVTALAGKVDKTTKIAGVDLQNDITKDEMKVALDIDDLESTKVDKTTTIAGVDLQNNITKEELQVALDVDDKVDKVTGKSLVEDTEIAKLIALDNKATLDGKLALKVDEDFGDYTEKLTLADNDVLPINDSEASGAIKKTTFKHIKDQIVIDGEVFDATVDYGTQGLGAFKSATTKIYALTLQTGGDYRTTIRIPETDTFVWVKFPDTSANANLLRVSLNNGTNYYNVIKNGARFKASIVSGQLVRLQFDGTQFIADIHNDVAITETYGETIESTYGLFNPQFEGIPLVKEIQGRTIPALENLVTNGDFSGGTTGWITNGTGIISLVDDYLNLNVDIPNDDHYITGDITPTVVGHKYYVSFKAKLAHGPNYAIGTSVSDRTIISLSTTNVWFNTSTVITATSISTSVYFFHGTSLYTVNEDYQIDNVHLIDLTATFGSGNEPTATEMDAIIEALGTNGYISTTSTTHVENTQLKSVGKNLFDKLDVNENKIVNTGNGNLDIFNGVFTTNYIRIFPNTAYTITLDSSEQSYGFYDINKNFISGAYTQATTFTTPSNAYYYRKTFSNSMNRDTIQLEEGTVATTYAPHITETQLFNHGRLSRLPNGVHDKVRFDNGAYVLDRYVQEYTLQASDITHIVNGSNVQYVAFKKQLDGVYATTSGGNGVVLAYRVNGFLSINNLVLPTYVFEYDDTKMGLGLNVDTYANLEAAQADLAGTKIWYQLATPLLATSTIDVDGVLLQDTVTTVQQLQDLPTTYLLEYAMNTDQTVATLVQRDKVQQLEIDSLETRTTALEARKETNKEIIFMSATDWASYTRVDGEVYGVWNETTGVITFYYGVVGV